MGDFPFDQAARQEHFSDQLEKAYISGRLAAEIRFILGNRMESRLWRKRSGEKFPEKTIWIYTGSLWETVKNCEVMKYVDVLVDGEYECDKRDTQLTEKAAQPAGDRCAGFSPQRKGSVAQQLKMRRINR